MSPCTIAIAIVGAESTGKSTLAVTLAHALRAEGRSVAVVPEYLREFCDAHGRTPRVHEQAGIAAEQTRRIAAACDAHEVVIADTTALMIAVYSEHVFGDRSRYAQAEADHRRSTLTLLTALDLPWRADGLQRDGPHVQAPVDALLRAAMQRSGIGFSIVMGRGEERTGCALRAVCRALARQAEADDMAGATRWQWHCERCGDAACERRLLPPGLS